MNATIKQLGKYHVLERLGQGGMAEVFRARQPHIERDVAIKVLHSHLVMSSDLIQRFQREARSLGTLRHPHIVSVIDFDVAQIPVSTTSGEISKHNQKFHYMVMDYVSGPTLAARIQKQGAPSLKEALYITEQIADALAYAHGRNTIHRDIKPGNVMFLDQACQHAVLTDFGIARRLDEATITAAGMMAGTPSYMSPEVVQGAPIDARSDIYSLGVLLYELVTGRTPYQGDTPVKTAMQHVIEPLPAIRDCAPDLPELVAQIIEKALAKAPADRFQSAAAMGQALRQAQLTLNDGHVQSTILVPEQTVIQKPLPQTRQRHPLRLQRHRAMPPLLSKAVTVTVQQPPEAGEQRSMRLLVILALLTIAIAASSVLFAEPVLRDNQDIAVHPTAAAEKIGRLQLQPVAKGQDVLLTMTDLTSLPTGHHYHAWIETQDHRILDLGTLTVVNGTATQQLNAPDAIWGLLDRVLITVEETETPAIPSTQFVASGQARQERIVALRQLLVESDTSLGKPLLAAAQSEANLAQTHATKIAEALAIGDLVGAQEHAEHVVNILAGEMGESFGDRNRDGQIQNPGDGVGVRLYLTRIDTVFGDLSIDHSALESAITKADAALIVARQITAADTSTEAQQSAAVLTTHLTELLVGTDLDGSGAIEPNRGEGALVATAESVAALSVVSLQRSSAQFIRKVVLLSAIPASRVN